MADLSAIYDELGLPGLVPHALRPGTQGYQMLLSKIRAGDDLYLLRSKLNAAFMVVKDEVYQALVFTSPEQAQAKQDALFRDGYTGVEIVPFPKDVAEREGALRVLCEDGPVCILVDDALSIPISAFADVPDYDGYPNEDHMLRNQTLNGATFYYLQIATDNMINHEAERYWAQMMIDSHFLVAAENEPQNGYPTLNIRIKNENYILVYTDWSQMSLDFDEFPAGITSTFYELHNLLRENPGTKIMLNNGSAHLPLDLETLDLIHQTAHAVLPVSADQGSAFAFLDGEKAPYMQTTEENWDVVDPTPDWLK